MGSPKLTSVQRRWRKRVCSLWAASFSNPSVLKTSSYRTNLTDFTGLPKWGPTEWALPTTVRANCSSPIRHPPSLRGQKIFSTHPSKRKEPRRTKALPSPWGVQHALPHCVHLPHVTTNLQTDLLASRSVSTISNLVIILRASQKGTDQLVKAWVYRFQRCPWA